MHQRYQRFSRRQRQHSPLSIGVAVCCCLLLTFPNILIQQSNAFSPTLSVKSNTVFSTSTRMNNIQSDIMPTASTTAMFAANKKASKADFEYQELKIQMNAMKQQDVKPSQLDPTKKSELERYVSKIVTQRDSTIPLTRLQDAIAQH